VFLPPDTTQARLRFPDRPFAAGKVRDLFSGRTLSLEDGPSGQECTVAPGRWRMALLCE
jgi:hypothetical protein